MEQIGQLFWGLLKLVARYALFVFGVYMLIGVIRDWKWVTEPLDGERGLLKWIYNKFGSKGYRLTMGVCSVIVVICGAAVAVLNS